MPSRAARAVTCPAVNTLVITGTGTGVGKTAVTAAIAALARADGRRVAVLKPAQTGVADDERGDLSEVVRLAGELTTLELARYPDPLSPDAAARQAALPPVRPPAVAAATTTLAQDHDLVLVEGAGGVLVRFDDAGGTLADVAWALSAPVLVVARPGLGTLNETALTTEVLRRRGISRAGLVLGQWPEKPDLAARCNLADLAATAEVPLLGALPDGAASLDRASFAEAASRALSADFGGVFDALDFSASNPP